MILGTTVVSVNCESGPAEIIQDGMNGRLVRDHSEIALATAIVKLLKDGALRDRMRKNALETVEKFSLKAGVDAAQRLFVQVASSRGGKPGGDCSTQ